MYDLKELNAVDIARLAYETDRAFCYVAKGEERLSWDELEESGPMDRVGRHPTQNEWIRRVRKELKRGSSEEPDYGPSGETMLRTILFCSMVKFGNYTRDGIPGL